MKSDAKNPKSTVTSVATDDAEGKRRAARRKFLARGTGVGSGLLIVTLYHQRGIAGGSKKIFTSSAEMCLSLKGTPGKTEKVPNPENPKEKVLAHQCSNVPDYKIPWMKK